MCLIRGLHDIYKKDKEILQVNAQKAPLGAIVLTRYNNKTYKIDDNDFGVNCLSTFIDHNGEEKTYMDYYKKHYRIVTKNPKQPNIEDDVSTDGPSKKEVGEMSSPLESDNLELFMNAEESFCDCDCEEIRGKSKDRKGKNSEKKSEKKWRDRPKKGRGSHFVDSQSGSV